MRLLKFMLSFVTGIVEGQKEKKKATDMKASAMPLTIVPKGSGILQGPQRRFRFLLDSETPYVNVEQVNVERGEMPPVVRRHNNNARGMNAAASQVFTTNDMIMFKANADPMLIKASRREITHVVIIA